jgi:hypothetical protein
LAGDKLQHYFQYIIRTFATTGHLPRLKDY